MKITLWGPSRFQRPAIGTPRRASSTASSSNSNVVSKKAVVSLGSRREGAGSAESEVGRGESEGNCWFPKHRPNMHSMCSVSQTEKIDNGRNGSDERLREKDSQ